MWCSDGSFHVGPLARGFTERSVKPKFSHWKWRFTGFHRLNDDRHDSKEVKRLFVFLFSICLHEWISHEASKPICRVSDIFRWCLERIAKRPTAVLELPWSLENCFSDPLSNSYPDPPKKFPKNPLQVPKLRDVVYYLLYVESQLDWEIKNILPWEATGGYILQVSFVTMMPRRVMVSSAVRDYLRSRKSWDGSRTIWWVKRVIKEPERMAKIVVLNMFFRNGKSKIEWWMVNVCE